MRSIFITLTFLLIAASHGAQPLTETRYGTEEIDGTKMFFREAGDPKNPAIVLLHGYPSSSHMYRNFMRHLASNYYLIAPDYPGFGNSDHPTRDKFDYTFDSLANVVDKFIQKRGIKNYSLMIQDFGAPIGFRIATRYPERVRALIIQNGNAYEEGMGKEAWEGVRNYWKDRCETNAQKLDPAFTLEGLRWQYTHGTRNPKGISPDNWNLDFLNISKIGTKEIMLDLFFDYQSNLKLYPQWQGYLRKYQPPTLIVWGRNDAYFPEAGAAAYKNDLNEVDYNIFDTGHFALEEDHEVIGQKARAFLDRVLKR